MELLDSLGSRLRRRRTRIGWSMRETAERSGLSERFIAQVEKGQANISVGKLAALSSVLDIQLYELFAPGEPSESRRALMHVVARARDEELEALRLELERRSRAQIIALLGMRGAGKSTVGRALAEHLGMRFVELDRRIEARAEMTLADIFSLHGPEYYVELELDSLRQLFEEREPCVLATGGGLVTHAESFGLLTRRAFCVWLRAQPETHWERVLEQGDRRPMAGNPRAFEQLCSILEVRTPLYARAELTVDTDTASVDALVETIASAVT